MKKILIPIIVIIGVLVAGYIIVTKDNKEKEVIKYVNNNYSELEIIADNYLNNNKVNHDSYIKYIVPYDNKVVEFYITDSYGFYYSKEDKPIYKNETTSIIELGNSKWRWDSDDGSKGIISKIRDNWYYFNVKSS